MKLKTLETLEYDDIYRAFKEKVIPLYALRQEAIKWIKALENIEENENGFEEFKDGEFTLSNVPYECCETSAVIGFIQHFFNITDEELK